MKKKAVSSNTQNKIIILHITYYNTDTDTGPEKKQTEQEQKKRSGLSTCRGNRKIRTSRYPGMGKFKRETDLSTVFYNSLKVYYKM